MAVHLIDSYSETNVDEMRRLSNANARCEGQVFNAGAGGVLDSMVFYLNQLLSPSGDVTAQLHSISGTPGVDAVSTGTVLATSDPIDSTTLAASPAAALQTFMFTGAQRVILTPGAFYAAIVAYSGPARVQAGADSSTPSHTYNGTELDSGLTWVTLGSDVSFYVYAEDLPPQAVSWIQA